MFITLFSSRCTALLRFSPASANRTNMQEKNHLSDFNVQGHILSTSGDALKSISTHTWYSIWTYASVYHIQNDVQVISTHKREIL